MYKAWFDGSFQEKTNVSVLGVYIENEEMDMVHSHSIIREDLETSSQAEVFALLSLLEVIKEQFKNERFMIYGDDQSLVRKMKGKNLEDPLIIRCKQLLKECKLKRSSLEWIERDYNKADNYTRIGQHRSVKSSIILGRMETEEMDEFILTNEAYKTYISKTKGNGNLIKKTAEKKLNRNIKRTQGKSFQLSDETVVYIYFGMLIFTKDNQITKLKIEKGDAKGVLHYQKNMALLEKLNQETKEEFYA